MKKYKWTIITSGVAAAIVCIIAVLAVNMNSFSNPAIEPQLSDSNSFSYENNFTESESYVESTKQSWLESLFSTKDETLSSALQGSTSSQSSETVSQTEEAESSSAAATVTEAITQLTSLIADEFSKVFKMPKAPSYIPPDTKIDISSINLASYKYYPEGNYYYTDDKDCWQKDFGFNEVYDKLAPVTIMYYDTVRTTFEYDNKEWLIQIWKGQYGYCFVGGEVGIYTRKIGSSGTHFSCADKSDWLNMEMAFIWDEYNDGNYSPIFTRPYEKYWWCTGFVVGFPNKNIRKTREEFRLVTHITFKDNEMATAFCNAFEKNGFARVSKLDNNEPDTFVQVGADVAFVWQNINQ